MADTFVKIATVTVGSGGASSIEFTSIPADYTDLCIKLSTRLTVNDTGSRMRFNSDSGANYLWRRLNSDGTNVTSNSNATYGSPYNTFIYVYPIEQSVQTANTFNNLEIYLPNYASSNNKSVSLDGVSENNGTASQIGLIAGLWSSTSAINSISFVSDSSGNFEQYSTATLYGIKNS